MPPTTTTLSSPAPIVDAGTHQFIEDVACGRIALPAVPRTLRRLIAAMRSHDPDLRETVAELAQDPVLAAKVMRLANSSSFGGRGSLGSIEAVVGAIGSSALNRLIVVCGISSAFIDVPGVNLREFWTDAMITASAAACLAERMEVDGDSAYLCGLMHASGHLMLCQAYPSVSRRYFAETPRLTILALAEREQATFGLTHAVVGALWADRLGLPSDIAEAIRVAVQPARPFETPLAAVLRCACLLATSLARGDAAEESLTQLPPAVRARFTAADAQPSAEFIRLHAALQRIEPMA